MHLTVTLHSALPAGDGAPDWVHLVPAGTFKGTDGRGPYTLANPAAVIRTSLQHFGARLPIDENHAIDLKAPKGEPSPARGWIVELSARADGIWGRVEWTGEGQRMVVSREYRGLSPALYVNGKGEIVAVGRASLVNQPNLPQLATLHHRSQTMDFLAQLRAALGLGADVPETDVLAAVNANKTLVDTHAASLKAIATAAGLSATLAADGIVTELQARQGAEDQTVAQLRGTVVELQTKLVTLEQGTARREATRVIDDAITKGKVGLVPLRDHYIDRHMKDPAGVEKEIGAMVSIHSSRHAPARIPAAGEPVLSAIEQEVCELMSVNPKEFAESRKQLGVEAI